MGIEPNRFPTFFLTSEQPCTYIDGKTERKIFMRLQPNYPPKLIDSMLRGNFRRSQRIIYRPHCNECSACTPARVLAGNFRPGRSFRRIIRHNTDLEVKRVKPRASYEQYDLFRHYITTRHDTGGMVGMQFHDFSMMVDDSLLVDTFILEYRKAGEQSARQGSEPGQLVAAALCDRLSDGISLVYSFFDPREDKRSLGTYMILDTIDYTRKLGLPHTYLGYWIDNCRKMNYKTRFAPQEHFCEDGWKKVSFKPENH
jgi:arginine-tRNA-protein transferase